MKQAFEVRRIPFNLRLNAWVTCEMAEGLELQLSGELKVLKDGEAAPLPPSRKSRALLAYLAWTGGEHRRERLCEIFWQIPDDPRASLRWALSRLRRVVNEEGVERIRATRDAVAFHAEGMSIDLNVLKSAAETGFDRLSLKALNGLAERFQGDVLEGLDLPAQPNFELWRLAEQEQARAWRRDLLRVLVKRPDGRPSDAVKWLYRLADLDPYNADVHRRLIKALSEAGRTDEAERQKRRSKEALAGVSEDEGRKVGLDLLRASSQVVQSGGDAGLRHEIRFCKSSNGVRIAYATAGAGRTIVKTANWLNHLQHDFESPVWAHIFAALTNTTRLVRYDARGNGLSDWNVSDFSFERQVEDLEAVVDAAVTEPFVLVGVSQGCAISIEYAARHPEKVSKLVLYGGYLRGWKKSHDAERHKHVKAMITLIRTGWGQENPAFRQMFTSLFMPEAPPEYHEKFNELQRITTSPENAAALMDALGDVDVTDRLAEVRAPALVLHATGDQRSEFEQGKEMALGLPDARFVSLETNNHLIPETDPAWPRCRDAIFDFLIDEV
ncbi:MAG: alpha/beta fold hydrolase [Pseudomonadota bacterium]